MISAAVIKIVMIMVGRLRRRSGGAETIMRTASWAYERMMIIERCGRRAHWRTSLTASARMQPAAVRATRIV